MLAVAGVVPALQFGNHLLQARRLRIERGDVLRGQPFDLARVPRRVFLELQQGGDLLQGKADVARVADEVQPRQIARAVAAVARLRARSGREQPLLFLIADLFGSEATLPRRFADVHRA